MPLAIASFFSGRVDARRIEHCLLNHSHPGGLIRSSMDLRDSLLLIFFCLPLIDGSCFTQTSCTTIRQFIRIIDPCATVTDCENACLGDPEVETYISVCCQNNVICALDAMNSCREVARLYSNSIPVRGLQVRQREVRAHGRRFGKAANLYERRSDVSCAYTRM